MRILFIFSLIQITFFFTVKAQEKNEYLRKAYQKKFVKYIQTDAIIGEYIYISDGGVKTYASPQDKEKGIVEYEIKWSELAVFRALIKQNPEKAFSLYKQGISPQYASSTLTKPRRNIGWNEQLYKPLANLKVAIDPGHIANSYEMGMLEGKFIMMDLPDEEIRFYESELTWATAKILKYKLEQLGAEVMMTRENFDETALGISYEEWFEAYGEEQKKKDIIVENTYTYKQRVFLDVFRTMELAERAKLINDFKPDLTVVIHYNVDGANKPWDKPTIRNSNVAFVGGGFLTGELEEIQDRFNMLRLLLTDDIENSTEFCRYVLASFERNLAVPTDQATSYGNALPTEVLGVHCRNLALTREVYGVVCFGESLYQDNEKECRALNKKDITVAGVTTSKRVVEVANAYLEAIVNYTKRH